MVSRFDFNEPKKMKKDLCGNYAFKSTGSKEGDDDILRGIVSMETSKIMQQDINGTLSYLADRGDKLLETLKEEGLKLDEKNLISTGFHLGFEKAMFDFIKGNIAVTHMDINKPKQS